MRIIQNYEQWHNGGEPIWTWRAADIARLCGVSQTTARRWLNSGGKWEVYAHIVSGGPLRPRYGLDREVFISLLSEERGEGRKPSGRERLVEELSCMIA